MKVFKVTIVSARPKGHFKHLAKEFLVLAETAQAAVSAPDLPLPAIGEQRTAEEQQELKGEGPWVVAPGRYRTLTPAEVSRLVGRAEPEAKKARDPALSSRPLGVTQLEILRCLKSRGKYPGGWVWGNPSATLKVLNALYGRMLVELNDHTYTINEQGLEALAAGEARSSAVAASA